MSGTPARIGGNVLAGLVSAVRLARRPRPLHPHGVALAGTLTPVAGRAASGLAGLDGLDAPLEVDARFSRGGGLPAALPDVLGLALRIPDSGGTTVDVLLASTGLSPAGRFLLAPHRSVSGACLSTLMPYRGSAGPVLLGVLVDADPPLPAGADDLGRALATRPVRMRLVHATPRGLWHVAARIELAHDSAGPLDTATRADPVLAAPPGDTTYPWTRRLRSPGYRIARHGRPVASRHVAHDPDA
ncbi:hypothetical protein ACR8AL_05805 [Clavibacter sepedonicus]|uniref:Uncharacterized protein n=1 Tax=Clavibacter sepedonicus TaxID=31964 RepID=B0RGI3_CLASE|nr:MULTISPECIES: hypothetical protein [Clavibacter]MBD5380963.1 hypothetical protein [Clavibacter sp.]OQJ46978.1 hypothetical protein B5P19_00790 [Clavibacter sepedonicus]OQJ55165.1 hypothetical protein B5P20_14480 [Clavibacter sepedonicus]UUK66509.1 hypothetical protein LRE50_04630 [Clavibacter sepedonicus]CAQ01241.1 conserved hypothetical protein [Clavibacter sepedonicus]